jgi:protein SCO1
VKRRMAALRDAVRRRLLPASGPALAAALAVGALAAGALPAAALPPTPPPEIGTTSQTLPGELSGVGFDQRLGAALPLDARFRDEEGREVTLGSYFGQRPVLLVPAYFTCPMLCSLVIDGISDAVRDLPFAAGEDYEVVVFSFDPDDTPAAAREKKERAVGRAGRSGVAAGMHFLTGDAADIRRLTAAIGFRYQRDPASRPGKSQFAHVAGVVVATPEGKVARYFLGINYPPRDVRLALVEAADGKTGSLVDQVLLFCFHYDPTTGRYSTLTMNAVRTAGLLTVLALALGVTLMLRRERHRSEDGEH